MAADNKKLITTYTQERRRLNAAIGSGKLKLDQHNKAVTAYNELGDRINLLIENGGMEKEIKAARAEQTKAREAYIDHVLAMEKLAEKVKQKLADLAEDPEAKAAVERLVEEARELQRREASRIVTPGEVPFPAPLKGPRGRFDLG